MSVQLNPLVVRELRGGLRSGRRVALLTVYLAIVGLFFLGVFQVAASTMQAEGGAANSSAIGGTFFPIVIGVELFFICTITPGQTAGAFASERERQTYDLLLVTPLRPRQLVVGKLVAGLAYMVLLLVAALPMASLAFLMGGVGLEELGLALVLLVMTLLLFGSLGLWASALLRGSRAAMALAYALTGLLTLGLPVFSFFTSAFLAIAVQSHPSLTTQPPPWLVYTGEFLGATNPWVVGALTEAQLQNGISLLWSHQVFGATHVDVPGPWLVFLAIYAVGTALFLWWTSRLVRRAAA